MPVNLFRTILEENGDYAGPAVYDRDSVLTYPDLFHAAEYLAGQLRAYGICRQARVAVLADDSAEYIAVSLAVLALDAAIVPFSSRAVRSEVEDMMKTMGINYLVCAEPFRQENDAELDMPQGFHDRFFVRKMDPEIRPVELPGGRIPAFIRFSSGTTGGSKGVILAHETVLERTSACTELGVSRGEKVFWVLDMAFHFVVTILLFLRKGACIVICPPPVERNMAAVLREHQVSLLYATPYHYRLMTASNEITPDMLSRVRRAFSTAMKLETRDAEAFRAKFSHPLTQAYGIIEVGLPCVNTSDRTDKTASVGRLQSAYRLRLADPDPSGAGRIFLNGPGLFDAYLTPFRLRTELDPQGWFDTGDIGRVDEEGYLFIVGRAKNVINFAGMKVFPYEVETVLSEHPWVAECRVSGRAAGAFGEVPAAEIVLRENVTLPDDWIDTLREFCYRRLASYKVPKFFETVKDLPHTASGKLIRK